MKICQVIFSTNRIEYLTRTLESQRLLDFGPIEVDKVFIDDYPQGRDDHQILSLAKSYGYKEIILHGENFGIGRTWTEFWSMIQRRKYDYIWHQEDDVVILEPIPIIKLINILGNRRLSQVVLMRQKWYPHETDPCALPTDDICEGFRIESQAPRKNYFSPLASLYSMDRVKFDYAAWMRSRWDNDWYFNEGIVGQALAEGAVETGVGLFSGHLKNMDGHNLCDHIGTVSQGKKAIPGEPWATPLRCDESPRNSVTGVLVSDDYFSPDPEWKGVCRKCHYATDHCICKTRSIAACT